MQIRTAQYQPNQYLTFNTQSIIMDTLSINLDLSFKYILLLFNFITILILYFHKKNLKITKQHHILFATAHPDDESMFFRPTIRSLTEEYFVHILVMTCKGTQRQQEMHRVGKALNIHHIEFVDSETIKDGMSQKWDLNEVRQKIVSYVRSNNIRAIFTFDNYGVSGHINHKSIYESLKTLEATPPVNQQQSNKQNKTRIPLPQGYIKIYYLESVMLPRKLSGMLEFPVAILKSYSWINLNLIDGYKMMGIHESQFVWYRKIWVFLSRYTYMNTFQRSIIRVNCPMKQKEQ